MTELPASSVKIGDWIQLEGHPSKVATIKGPDSETGEYTYRGQDLFRGYPTNGFSFASASGSDKQVVGRVETNKYQVGFVNQGRAICVDEEKPGQFREMEVLGLHNLRKELWNALEESDGKKIYGLSTTDNGQEAIIGFKVEE